MELVSASPNVQIEFQVSLSQNLFTNALLLDAVDRLEGLGDWVVHAATGLPASLRGSLRRFSLMMGYCPGLWGELIAPSEREEDTSFDIISDRLEGTPERGFRIAARRGLGRRLAEWDLASAGVALDVKEAELGSLLALVWERRTDDMSSLPGETVAEAQSLASFFVVPGQLKHHLLATLDDTWRRLYRSQFARDLPQIRRAVAYHRGERYPPEFRAAFIAITGRTLPPALEKRLDGVRRVILAPSCHIGPYLVFAQHGQALFVSFNANTASARPAARSNIAVLYPPLKSLADETRLQILVLLTEGERYVGEIAGILDLSHSSASRHLNLLTAAGVLEMRKEHNQRFFRLNRGRVQSLIADLQELFQL